MLAIAGRSCRTPACFAVSGDSTRQRHLPESLLQILLAITSPHGRLSVAIRLQQVRRLALPQLVLFAHPWRQRQRMGRLLCHRRGLRLLEQVSLAGSRMEQVLASLPLLGLQIGLAVKRLLVCRSISHRCRLASCQILLLLDR